jgi:hypothetical protein
MRKLCGLGKLSQHKVDGHRTLVTGTGTRVRYFSVSPQNAYGRHRHGQISTRLAWGVDEPSATVRVGGSPPRMAASSAMSCDRGSIAVAVQHNGQDEPDPDPEPDPHALQGFVDAWFTARPLLQLTELVAAGQHEGLHLAAQALMVLGDLAAVSLDRLHR